MYLVPVKDAEGKEVLLYVWFDAPIGYISATKDLRPNDWELYWKDKETRLIHFIGKIILCFTVLFSRHVNGTR